MYEQFNLHAHLKCFKLFIKLKILFTLRVQFIYKNHDYRITMVFMICGALAGIGLKPFPLRKSWFLLFSDKNINCMWSVKSNH